MVPSQIPEIKNSYSLLILTGDHEVSEDQKAAAAEADGTVGGSQWRQEEETAGQFTYTQHRRSFQHSIHC